MTPRVKGRKRIAPKVGPLMVDGDEYMVRLNPPIGAFADLVSGDLDRIVSALSVVVAESPFVDDADQPLPVSQWPLPEITAFTVAYGALMNALPPG